MQISKQKGFTLIELLVVIVIIGILATISVATFSGYFAKARDAERQAAVRNAATVLKTARAVETIQSFDYDRTEGLDGSTADIDGGVTTIAGVENVLSAEGGFIVPEPSTTDYEYVYVEPTTNPGNSFAIFICSEENAAATAGAGDRVFVDGTADLVGIIRAGDGTICPDGGATNNSIDLDTLTSTGTGDLVTTVIP